MRGDRRRLFVHDEFSSLPGFRFELRLAEQFWIERGFGDVRLAVVGRQRLELGCGFGSRLWL